MIRKPQQAALPAILRNTGKFAAATIGALLLAAPVQAEIIRFEGGFGPAIHNDVYVEGKFSFLSLGSGALTQAENEGTYVGEFFQGSDSAGCGVSMACPTNNPSTYYGALNDGYVSVFANDGRGFSVKSLAASYIGNTATITGYPAVAGLLRVQGWDATGASLTQTFNLAGPAAAGFQFSNFTLAAAFAAREWVELAIFGFTCNTAGSCNAFTTNRGQFAIDNLDLVQVPEPASALLVALGLAGLVNGARRRKA